MQISQGPHRFTPSHSISIQTRPLTITTPLPTTDYSSALQRDILVHGRLYVSQNYLCFYSNIFGWETCLTLKLKDVTAVTKEKTALVIPNAILITTETDKHFFTSFTARDTAYLMLFRVWQNALMDKSMQPAEIWKWIHYVYGEELGLTTEDEDYIDPTDDLPLNKKGKPSKALLHKKLHAAHSTATDSVSEVSGVVGTGFTDLSTYVLIDSEVVRSDYTLYNCVVVVICY